MVASRSSSRGVAHAQTGERGRCVEEQVPFADDLEPELRVQRFGPVVGERLEEDEIVRSPAPRQRVLDDDPAEAAATVRLQRVHVLDLRRRAVAAQLAVRGDNTFDLDREVAASRDGGRSGVWRPGAGRRAAGSRGARRG